MNVVRYKILSGLYSLAALLLMLGAGQTVNGQQISYHRVMEETGKVRESFKANKGTYVSCGVMYYYSTESKPTHYLDSLKGLFRMTGGVLYNKIGNTEMIRNDSVSVVLYNDDKTILAGPVALTTTLSGHDLFVDNLDSAFVDGNVDSVVSKEANGLKTMSFYMNKSSRYYNCTLVYSSTTHVPMSLSYVLRSTKVAEIGAQPRDGSLITILFSGYSRAAFDTSLVSIDKYIRIGADGKAKAQTAYGSYNLIQTASFRVSDN